MVKSSPIKTLARTRINKLFLLASRTSEVSLANRYVELARKIAMKARISLDPSHRKLFCHSCYAFLPSTVSRRVTAKTLTITCPSCKKVNRYPFS